MNAPRRLPIEAVDWLFRRLVATYGRRFWLQWEGVEPADVKAVWARELGGYTDRGDVFAWAMENLPEAPPNAIEFRNLCRRAPAPKAEQLPEPPADPQRVAQALAEARQVLGVRNTDSRAWASRVIKRAEAGEHVRPATLSAARAVLRASISDPA